MAALLILFFAALLAVGIVRWREIHFWIVARPATPQEALAILHANELAPNWSELDRFTAWVRRDSPTTGVGVWESISGGDPGFLGITAARLRFDFEGRMIGVTIWASEDIFGQVKLNDGSFGQREKRESPPWWWDDEERGPPDPKASRPALPTSQK